MNRMRRTAGHDQTDVVIGGDASHRRCRIACPPIAGGELRPGVVCPDPGPNGPGPARHLLSAERGTGYEWRRPVCDSGTGLHGFAPPDRRLEKAVQSPECAFQPPGTAGSVWDGIDQDVGGDASPPPRVTPLQLPGVTGYDLHLPAAFDCVADQLPPP